MPQPRLYDHSQPCLYKPVENEKLPQDYPLLHDHLQRADVSVYRMQCANYDVRLTTTTHTFSSLMEYLTYDPYQYPIIFRVSERWREETPRDDDATITIPIKTNSNNIVGSRLCIAFML